MSSLFKEFIMFNGSSHSQLLPNDFGMRPTLCVRTLIDVMCPFNSKCSTISVRRMGVLITARLRHILTTPITRQPHSQKFVCGLVREMCMHVNVCVHVHVCASVLGRVMVLASNPGFPRSDFILQSQYSTRLQNKIWVRKAWVQG